VSDYVEHRRVYQGLDELDKLKRELARKDALLRRALDRFQLYLLAPDSLGDDIRRELGSGDKT
jgi:hypothetical protein